MAPRAGHRARRGRAVRTPRGLRTPLREALARLAADGLVAAQGGRGLVVTRSRSRASSQLFELRRVLEQEAARLAARHRDPGGVPRRCATSSARSRAARRRRPGPRALLRPGGPLRCGRRRGDRQPLPRRARCEACARISCASAGSLTTIPSAARRRRRAPAHRRRDRRGRAELAASATQVHLYRSLHSVLASAERLTIVREEDQVKLHDVRVHRSDENLAREDQLAWKIAEVAADPVAVDRRGRRDGHQPHHRQRGRRRGLAHPRPRRRRARAGARRTRTRRAPPSSASTGRFSPEWAAWANGVAVRELDYHDTFLAAEYSHPGDNIPPILAVAQHARRDGADARCAASPPATRSRSTS